jgi:hypothetical protein
MFNVVAFDVLNVTDSAVVPLNVAAPVDAMVNLEPLKVALVPDNAPVSVL